MPSAAPWEKYQATTTPDSGSSPKPWENYQSPASADAARKKNTEVESAFQGAVQGASMGFADELEGAVRAGGNAVTSGKIKGLNDLVDSYRGYRDQARARNELARQDNPVSYTGGEVVGSVGTSFIPGFGWMNAAKGATTAAKLGIAAKAGAVIGAGTSNADLTEGQIGDNLGAFAGDVAQGAATGVAVQGALSGAGKVAEGIADRFKNLPEQRAVKAVTGQNISGLRQISGTTFKSAGDVGDATDRIVKVGRDILDEPGVLGPLSKVEDIAPKLGQAREKYGKLIGEVGDQIDKAAPNSVDAKNIASNIVTYAESIPETLQGQRLRDKLVEEAANFEKIGALNFVDAQKFKNQFKYKPVDADALISNQDAVNKVRGIISKEMESTVEKLSAPQDGVINMAQRGSKETPQIEGIVPQGASFQTDEVAPLKDLIENYKLYKSKYGSFKSASDAATDRVQKNLTNRFISPSDYGIGAALGTAQSVAHGAVSPATVALGAGAALANKFARERGSALAARTAEGILKAYKSGGVQGLVEAASPLIDAARKGNAAAVATFQILSQSNPRAVEILNQREAMQKRLGGQ